MKIFIRMLIAFSVFLCIYTAIPYLSQEQKSLAPVTAVPQRATVLGYDRASMFGGWLGGVREAIVAEADDIDPYAGDALDISDAEVDHIFPLSAAWDLGAHSWSAGERIQFANDPLNLVLVSRAENQEKSDQLPSQWLPSDRSVRCWYVSRLFSVANAYELPLPEEDIRVSRKQCGFAKLW
ncbi:GmrSD restriction endonuclease domain-containing protein [Corynebacterium crudilactis]|uniref:GmrSD restriction endonucleases C-terminal domain-containing protein n=1 Tax=Corynebacterium crudilactis TaxID=1652495 RepID=A0A172QST6_9CORY|nr:DUF1524 domain-containing protein [Corynebacterium crudilactis]ANE03732.1 hypothetical protein ccrud_05585 [Corynebacterium crudilactis]